MVLIGHGATQDNKQLFQLNESEVILAGQIQLDTPKQLIIIESCRVEIDKIFTVDLDNKIPKFADGGVVRRPINRGQARALYDFFLSQSDEGLAVCFACSIGESAKNYYFSNALLQIAFNWHLENTHTLQSFSTAEVMSIIDPEVDKISSEQTQENQHSEFFGNSDFPFAISKFG